MMPVEALPEVIDWLWERESSSPDRCSFCAWPPYPKAFRLSSRRASPCWRRLSRLKEAGYIRGQVTLLDAEKLGLGTMVFASVRLSAHGRANLTEFSEAIRRLPEVVECHAIMGTFDFLLRIVTRDIRAYEQFLFSRLSTLATVQEINSTMALSEIKSTTALPLRAR